MRIKPTINEVKAVRLSVLLGILTFSIPSTQTFAETSPLSSRPDPINWIVGPAKADLGENAEIQIPAGYRFVGVQDARTLLKLTRNPAPETLAGILTPNSGGYIVVFESSTVGHIKDSSETLNPTKILRALQKKVERQNAETAQGAVPVAALKWEKEPTHDRSEHLLEWAIRAETGTSSSINHVVRLLGRETMLDAIAVQSSKADESIPLKEIMANVSFKPGHAYADYQEGDWQSKLNLAESITTEPGSLSANQPAKWAYIVGGASLFAVGGGLLVFKRKPRNTKPASHNTISRLNGNGSKLFTNGSLARANGHSNGRVNGNGHGKPHRRRIFDYQKYYSDLMFQVSDRAYETSFTPKPKASSTAAGKSATTSDATALSANVSLIESQKRLIEEQQRLIREQTKLIEEKTRLIHEKNQVLDKQSELFGNNVF